MKQRSVRKWTYCGVCDTHGQWPRSHALVTTVTMGIPPIHRGRDSASPKTMPGRERSRSPTSFVSSTPFTFLKRIVLTGRQTPTRSCTDSSLAQFGQRKEHRQHLGEPPDSPAKSTNSFHTSFQLPSNGFSCPRRPTLENHCSRSAVAAKTKNNIMGYCGFDWASCIEKS